MKAITNTSLIESRAKWGRRIAPFTMFFLVGGLITNFLSIWQPEYFQITLFLLFIGFILAIISSHLVNNWVKEPRSDQILGDLLKKFGNDYVLLNYTAPVAHVLIAPDAVHVITVKRQDGQISVNGRKVSRSFSVRRLFKFFGEEGLGAPVNEAEANVNKLTKFLSKSLNDEELPPTKPLLLFTNKEARLTINDPAIPTMPTNELKAYLRAQGKQRNISADRRKQLADILANEVE